VVVLLAGAVLSIALPRLYSDLLHSAEGVILILTLAIVADFAFRPYAASLRARSYFFAYDLAEIFTYLVFKFGLVLYLSYSGMSLWALALVTLGESLARNLLTFVLALRCCNWTARIETARVDSVLLKRIAGFSGACFLISLANLFSYQIDAAVIGYFVADPAAQIAIYGIGTHMLRLIISGIGVTWSVLIPRFSGLAEKGDSAAAIALLRTASRTTGVLTVFAMVSVCVFGEAFLRLWINKPWVSDSYVILLIMAPGYLIALLQGPANGLLWGAGKLRLQTIMTVGEALANVCLSVLLVQWIGMYGVCIGTAVPMLLTRGLVFPYVLQRECGVSVASFWRMQARSLLLGLVYLIAIAGFTRIRFENFLQLGVACVAATLIFGLLTLLLLPETRTHVNAACRRISARLRRH
jgi:O-antigen/teichoic acid export membrane protein